MNIFQQIAAALVDGEAELTLNLVNKCIADDIDINQIVDEGLAVGIKQVGDYFEDGEFFLPELMQGAEIMKSAMEILNPIILEKTGGQFKSKGRVVIGTVAGDIHDIGKTLVASMLTASGYEVHDMGADVPIERFLNEVIDKNADLLCMSALLTTTMINQREVISKISEKGLRNKVKILVGGAPVTKKWAQEIGADGFAENAVEAVKIANILIGVDD
ncbi:MAG: dimethylamine corrinoid protein 3 [Candidatus Heimdallarchaeota archaeon]|nr:dimethylamine corrinoid protein 3 [Candidatus Heimdallarchaeota archaeon]